MDHNVKAMRKSVGRGIYRTVWADMKPGGVGEAVEVPDVVSSSVQVVGDMLGAEVVLEGSLETFPTTWFPLFSDDGVTYNTGVMWFRPRVMGGEDGALTVIVLSRNMV